jgi:uncharacterized membrane protein YbhN (UPF0104 family)
MLLATGLPAVVALVELGVIIWLWLSRRNARREIIELTLRARRAELREPPVFFSEWDRQLRKEGKQ